MKQNLSFFFLALNFTVCGQKMMMFKDATLPKPTERDIKVAKWNNNQLLINNLSAQEKAFYYWVNYSRIDPSRFFDSVVVPIATIYPQLKGTNYTSLKRDLKNSPELPMFQINQKLLDMAVFHANDITRKNASPSHNSTSGESFPERFKKSGLLSACVSENISFGGGDGDPLFMLVLLYLDLNVADLGHRKTLLDPKYTQTGIGVSRYKNGNTFIVQDFACPSK